MSAADVSAARRFSSADLASLIPHPHCDAHKYSRGHLVVVGGSAAYPGAASLAAFAGQRTGAGYTEVHCAPESVAAVRAYRPSFVVRSWSEEEVDRLPISHVGKPVALVVGPGIDADDAASREPIRAALAADAAVLVDGGALTMLASPEGRAAARDRAERGLTTVVSPHAGEAARLAAPFHLPTDDASVLARAIAHAYGVVAVVKGPATWISNGDRVACMDDGTPALAKAGTGDVLAGMIGALLAQGIVPFEAALLGATLHAYAGCAAADALTDVCITPEDVIDAIPHAIRRIEEAAALS